MQNSVSDIPQDVLNRQIAILDAIPDIVVEVDNNKKYIWSNRIGLAFFGSDMIGHAADYYFEGEQDVYTKVDPLFKGTEDTVYLESWQRRSDGQKRLLAWWCHTLKDEHGGITGAISTARDITDQRNAEESLWKSQILLQNIIDLLPVRIFWKDLNLKYLGCNQVFARDAGKNTPSDLIGKDDFDMAWKNQAELYRSDDNKVITTRQAKLNYEEPQTTINGETTWLNTNKVPLIDKNGNVSGVVGTYLDVTDRKIKEKRNQVAECPKSSACRKLGN
jgi:PAS domain S-box-containing protein